MKQSIRIILASTGVILLYSIIAYLILPQNPLLTENKLAQFIEWSFIAMIGGLIYGLALALAARVGTEPRLALYDFRIAAPIILIPTIAAHFVLVVVMTIFVEGFAVEWANPNLSQEEVWQISIHSANGLASLIVSIISLVGLVLWITYQRRQLDNLNKRKNKALK